MTRRRLLAAARNPVLANDAPDPSVIRARDGAYYAWLNSSTSRIQGVLCGDLLDDHDTRAPPIDPRQIARSLIYPPGSDWFVPRPKIDVSLDGYQTTEIYSIRHGILRNVFRKWEGVVGELAPIWGDWSGSAPLYMWVPGTRGSASADLW